MKEVNLADLQESVQDRSAFKTLSDYLAICHTFLNFVKKEEPTRIITVALNRLDGVYYVDPMPEMLVNERFREQIHDFQQFLVKDLWVLSKG
jgi:hypothetical protein